MELIAEFQGEIINFIRLFAFCVPMPAYGAVPVAGQCPRQKFVALQIQKTVQFCFASVVVAAVFTVHHARMVGFRFYQSITVIEFHSIY